MHRFTRTKKFLTKNKVKDAKKILEIGCGIGRVSREIARIYKKSDIISIDFDKKQIIKARKNNKKYKNISFHHGNALSLKEKEGTFDLVIEFDAFHHIFDYEKAIKETNRVLKKGGLFILKDSALKVINPFPKKIKLQPAQFSKKEFINRLKRNGFIVIKQSGFFRFSVVAKKR